MKRLRILLAVAVLTLAMVPARAQSGGCTFLYDMTSYEEESGCIAHTTWYDCGRLGIVEVDWWECYVE